MGMMNQRSSKLTAGRRAWVAAAATVALFGLANAASADEVFDNITNHSGVGYSGAGDQFMGGAYTLTPNTVDITGFDLSVVNFTSATTFTAVKDTIYVWGTVNTGTVSATNPAFSNLLATITTGPVSFGPGNLPSGYGSTLQGATPGVTPFVSLTTPLALPSGTTTIGLSFSWQGTTDGTNYATAQGLTTPIAYGSPASVGTEPTSSFFTNISGADTNGNFTSGPYAFPQTTYSNQSVNVDVFGDIASAPEPTSLLLAGVAAGPLALRRRRRRAATTAA